MKTLKRPLISEKSMSNVANGQYAFMIYPEATKNSISDEIEKLYKVKVEKVRIVNLPAKSKNFRRRKGMQSARPKAYIWLQKGQKLPGFELQPDEKDKKDKNTKETKVEENKESK